VNHRWINALSISYEGILVCKIIIHSKITIIFIEIKYNIIKEPTYSFYVLLFVLFCFFFYTHLYA